MEAYVVGDRIRFIDGQTRGFTGTVIEIEIGPVYVVELDKPGDNRLNERMIRCTAPQLAPIRGSAGRHPAPVDQSPAWDADTAAG